MPFCYSYDKFADTKDDFGKIAVSLINHPGCAVSFQLIPSKFSAAEEAAIDSVTQDLNTLSKGLMNQGVGNISFALAEKHFETYKYYSDNKNASLYEYNILIYGDRAASDNIASRIFGRLSAGANASANIKTIRLPERALNVEKNFTSLPWMANEIVAQTERNASVMPGGKFHSYYRLPFIITAEEAVSFFVLPIGSDNVSAGFTVNLSDIRGKTFLNDIINSGDITIGRLRSSANNATLGFKLGDLTKHMLVVGTPGSGKTTFSVSLLDRLWKEHNIPFLVIEPAKNEYRALLQSIPDIQIFTPGKNFISPLSFNPFVPPENVKLEAYKSTLKTAFEAGVAMSSPLDKIFEETINNCYSEFRWLDSYTSADKGNIFNISDFIKCFRKTFDKIGYTGDAKNIGRAGLVRLKSIANLFDDYNTVSIGDILKKPTIIELAAIENTEQKALIIALILLSVMSYVNANYYGEGSLKNVILLEEAHVLLDADTSNSQGEANSALIAQGLIKRMLAEIRAYGVGVVIADQSPRKVSADVVALTDMKVVFRLVESTDKKMIADSTNMDENDIQRLSRLRPGEAFVFFNKLEEPEEVVTPDYRANNDIKITLSDENIKSIVEKRKGSALSERPYPQCEFCSHCGNGCDRQRRALAREIAARIFNNNFTPASKDFETIRKVFARITAAVKRELNGEPFSKELLSCVKVHLFRKIIYETDIKIGAETIKRSIEK